MGTRLRLGLVGQASDYALCKVSKSPLRARETTPSKIRATSKLPSWPRSRQLRQLRRLRQPSLLQKSVLRSSASSRSSLHLPSVPAHTLALRLTSARGSSRWSRTSHGVGSLWSERARIAGACMSVGCMGACGEVCSSAVWDAHAATTLSVSIVCAHACLLRIRATPALTAVLAVHMHM